MIYKTIDEWIEHNPNHMGALPIEVCHQIFGTKDNKTTRVRVEEDDDIQDYKKPWVGLTDEERLFVLVTAPPTFMNHKGDVRETAYTFAEVVQKLTEKKLKEKNT